MKTHTAYWHRRYLESLALTRHELRLAWGHLKMAWDHVKLARMEARRALAERKSWKAGDPAPALPTAH